MTTNTPSFQEQMDKFQSFAMKDGEISDGGPTAKEVEVLAAREAQGFAGKPNNEAELPLKEVTESKAVKEAAKTDQEATEESEETDTSEETEVANEADAENTAAIAANPAEKPKAKASANERIGQAIKKQRAAERDAEAERSARIEMQKRLDAIEARLTPPKEPVKEDGERPTPDKFEYGELDTKYITALAKYEARQEIRAERAADEKKRQTEAAAASQREIQAKAASVIEAGRAKYDDFDDVVLQSPIINKELTQVVHDLLLESDVGPDIAHHLASNPKEAREIFSKSPARQAALFGALEAKFSATSAAEPPKAVKTTKAPPPVKAVRGAGSKPEVPGETSDFAAFEAQWRAQNR
jgi:hypothetical protein